MERRVKPPRRSQEFADLAILCRSANNLQQRNKEIVIEKAADDVRKIRAANGGKSKYGDITSVISRYQSVGFDFVTRGSVCYRLNAKTAESNCISVDIPTDVEFVSEGGAATIRSDLSGSEREAPTNHHSNKGGRPIGITNSAKLEKTMNLHNALTKAAIMFAEERAKATQERKSVRNGCLDEIAEKIEAEFDLPSGTINKHTVVSRVRRNNLTAFAHQRVSPVDPVEPYIVEYCIRLANMGAALDKDQVLTLANSVIDGTEFRKKLMDF